MSAEDMQIKEETPEMETSFNAETREIEDIEKGIEHVKLPMKYEENFSEEDEQNYTVLDKVKTEISEHSSEESQSTDNEADEDIPNYCKVCKGNFDGEDGCRDHYRQYSTHPVKKLGCCNCRKCFRDFGQLKVHQRSHTGEKPYTCNICSKHFSVKGNLTKHKILHTGVRRFECEVCEKKFTQFAHLDDHVKIHSGERPFRCDECDMGFKSKSKLKKHILSHDKMETKRKRNYCHICNKSFTFIQFDIHMRRHKNLNQTCKCPVCDYIVDTYFDLQVHMKSIHADSKIFKCDICDKRFSNSTHLSRHLRTHAGIKPYICDICSRPFPNTQNLKRHLLVHKGEKPFKCETCERSFSLLGNLTRHMRTHTKEKPYPCTVCNKTFAHSTTMKEHLLTHTNEKLFGCGVCNKRFYSNRMLYRHIREKHPEKTVLQEGTTEPTNFVSVKTEIKEELEPEDCSENEYMMKYDINATS